jgi:glycosyltransferase involved in cell wall biosynthesis
MVEVIPPELENHFEIITASSKLNPILRIIDMMIVFIKNINRSKLILIDTYSTSAFYYTFFLAVVSNLFSKPYCPILHGGGLPERLEKTPILAKFTFGNAYKNISPSKYLMKIFKRKGYGVAHIPNFIDVKRYSMKIRKQFRPRLLWVRSFHEIYNPILAIHVVNILLKQWQDTELCMIGPNKGGYLQIVKKEIDQLKIGDRVIIKGKLEKEEWKSLAVNYDIFINTSNFDNHPVSLLEIMALGLPIVTTNVGGIPSMIDDGKTGILINSKNPNEFANIIGDLLSGEINGTNISKNARKEVLKYDKSQIIKKWTEFLNRIY